MSSCLTKKHALYFITKNRHSVMFKGAFGVRGENSQKKGENVLREQNSYYSNVISVGNYSEYSV